ncbi:hypothetical protein T484DRAFT_1811085 [Baffinella frigidus]|nr:hypothetical protein T484DRAFT_1811085 [Cryptophyta sp. CCMP2293]
MLLATASKEVSVKIWNVFSGEQVGTLRGHDGEEGCTCAVDAPTEDLSLLRDPGCEMQGHSKVIPDLDPASQAPRVIPR